MARWTALQEPGVRADPRHAPRISVEQAGLAIRTAGRVLELAEPGPLLCRRGPRGEVHCDLPLMYQGFALDRIHVDPWGGVPLPRGLPHAYGQGEPPVLGSEEIQKIMGGLRVLDAAEYREPEKAWAVPVAWRNLVVAYIKIDVEGREVVPDYPLTEEVVRRV